MALIDLQSGTVLEAAAEPAATLPADAKPEVMTAAAATAGPVAIEFPKFSDGRGMSLARLMRDRHGYKGELRAVGHLIPDLAQFLLRSGFDTAEIADDASAATWNEVLNRIRHLYQPAYRSPFQLRRDFRGEKGSGSLGGDAASLDARLAELGTLEARIEAIGQSIKGRIAFSTSLGLEDQAILHAIAETKAPIDVFTLDTGRLFPETLETLEASELRYGVRIAIVAPDAKEVEQLVARDGIFGFRHSIENRVSCCEIRKVRPLARALKGAKGWVTGLRRDQSQVRDEVAFASLDETRGLTKVNPLADWSQDRVEAYLDANRVPVNPLHAKGFISIGCQPCTRAIQPGEHPRAGRWWWENEEKKECGLHLNPNRPQPNRTEKAA